MEGGDPGALEATHTGETHSARHVQNAKEMVIFERTVMSISAQDVMHGGQDT